MSHMFCIYVQYLAKYIRVKYDKCVLSIWEIKCFSRLKKKKKKVYEEQPIQNNYNISLLFRLNYKFELVTK